MGANPSSDVGLYIRSLAQAENLDTGEMVNVPGGQSAYVSPSWRSSAGRTITVDGVLWDWLGSNFANEADDMMPGAVALNATTQAHLRVTWDSNYMFAALVGPTFVSTDGLFYLDTAPGGSSTGDMWHSQHTLPIQADYMLWMEDLNNWGLRKVMPTGNWVDVTSSCPQIDSSIFVGNPFTTTPVSEFRIPWSCLGSPAEEVRWIAMVQWDSPFGQDGQVAGVFPEQPFNNTMTPVRPSVSSVPSTSLEATYLHPAMHLSHWMTTCYCSEPTQVPAQHQVRLTSTRFWSRSATRKATTGTGMTPMHQ